MDFSLSFSIPPALVLTVLCLLNTPAIVQRRRKRKLPSRGRASRGQTRERKRARVPK